MEEQTAIHIVEGVDETGVCQAEDSVITGASSLRIFSAEFSQIFA